jgi:hypothetical protein
MTPWRIRTSVLVLVLAVMAAAAIALAQPSAWRPSFWTDPASGATIEAVQARSSSGIEGMAVIACDGDGAAVLALASVALQDLASGELDVAYALDDGAVGDPWGEWSREANGAVLRWAGDEADLATFLTRLAGAQSVTFAVLDREGAELVRMGLDAATVDSGLRGLACV